MPNMIYADMTASITELKKNPMATVDSAEGMPLAILNRNKPAFYCIPATIYEAMLDLIDDIELAEIVRQRKDGESIEIDIDDL